MYLINGARQLKIDNVVAAIGSILMIVAVEQRILPFFIVGLLISSVGNKAGTGIGGALLGFALAMGGYNRKWSAGH